MTSYSACQGTLPALRKLQARGFLNRLRPLRITSCRRASQVCKSSGLEAVGEVAAETQVQHPNASVKVIGLGARGISSVNTLAASGQLENADLWAIDSDKKVLSGVQDRIQIMEVSPGDDVTLVTEDLGLLMSPGHVEPPAGTPDGASGVCFILGSALGSPGGSTLLLQLANYLKRQGFFVTAALTRPFGFEGPRKLEQADVLIQMLEEVADLVVVVDQAVLSRAAADMTIAEASAIADKTLQYTVRSIVWALRAPETLMVHRGLFLWHGRDLRTMRRPLFPPMMSLLTCPGHAYLGRGQAALPLETMKEVGLASTLSTLAEDATHAAAMSPFLEERMPQATAVLCVLIFPQDVLAEGAAWAKGEPAPGRQYSPQENNPDYALRLAVQVAAMTIRDQAGPQCLDVVVCPQVDESLNTSVSTPAASTSSTGPAAQPAPADPNKPAATTSPTPGTSTSASVAAAVTAVGASEAVVPGSIATTTSAHVELPSGKLVRVECALLVLNRTPDDDDDGSGTGAPGKTASSAAGRLTLTNSRARQRTVVSRTASKQPAGNTTTSVGEDEEPSVNPSRVTRAAPGTRQAVTASFGFESKTRRSSTPSSPTPSQLARQPAWQAMSMLAGGTAPDMTSKSASTPKQASSVSPPGTSYTPSGSGTTGSIAGRRLRQSTPLSTDRTTTTPSPAVAAASQSSTSQPGVDMKRAASRIARVNSPEPATGSSSQSRPGAADQDSNVVAVPRVSGNLATMLVAQSLDLPPRAAKWRHQQRAANESTSSYVYQVDGVDAEGQGGEGEGGAKLSLADRLMGGRKSASPGATADIRSRVAGMLEKERS